MDRLPLSLNWCAFVNSLFRCVGLLCGGGEKHYLLGCEVWDVTVERCFGVW